MQYGELAMEWVWLVDELRLNAEEKLLFDALKDFRNADEFSIREGIAIFRKFREWHGQNPEGFPDLGKPLKKGIAEGCVLSFVEIRWFCIEAWWEIYCDARKRTASPKAKDLRLS